jgi:hypothetical protein
MESKEKQKHRIFIDLERLNRLNTGCLACGHRFSLGDEVILARGKWHGFKYIHVQEAVFDSKTDTHYERKYYRAVHKSLSDEG